MSIHQTTCCSQVSLDLPCRFPMWPKTKEIQLQHKTDLEKFFKKNKTMISELSFAGIFLFSQNHKYSISFIDNTLIIVSNNKEQPYVMIPFSSPSEQTVYTLLYAGYYIKLISHFQKKNYYTGFMAKKDVRIEQDPGDFDYMYKKNNLALLAGRKYHKKRNLIHLFHKKCTDVYTTNISKENKKEVFHILNIWKTNHPEGDFDIHACFLAIQHLETLGLIGQITFVSGNPAGFVIGEYRNNGVCVVIHFEKADIQYTGIYQYINQMFVQSLPDYCRVINREQDLGKEGLRQAKHSYHPTALLKKYRLYLNE